MLYVKNPERLHTNQDFLTTNLKRFFTQILFDIHLPKTFVNIPLLLIMLL